MSPKTPMKYYELIWMIFVDKKKTYNKKKVSLSQNDSSVFWD